MPSKRKDKKQENVFKELPENMLGKIYGGLGVGYNDFSRMNVRCPYPGCNFECNDFMQMNEHIKHTHWR